MMIAVAGFHQPLSQNHGQMAVAASVRVVLVFVQLSNCSRMMWQLTHAGDHSKDRKCLRTIKRIAAGAHQYTQQGAKEQLH